MKSIYIYASLFIVTSLLIPGAYAISGNSPQSAAVVNAISPYLQTQTHVYISINNNQSVTIPVNYNEMIVVNSSEYSIYENSNLSNVYFTYTNGTMINSWLQSGNSFNDNNTTYWLKLKYSISADSAITIEMNFLPLGQNAFNGVTTGEAPQLSKMYGQFDNGQNVFRFYDNFAGTTLNNSKWIANGIAGNCVFGNATVNNSLHITGPNDIYTRANFSYPSYVESCGLIGPGGINNNSYFLNGVGFSSGGYYNSFSDVASGWATNTVNGPGMSLWNANGVAYTYNYSKSIDPNRFHVYGIGYVNNNNIVGVVDGQVENSSHVGINNNPGLNATIGFQCYDYSPNNTFYWVFVRNATTSGIINLPYSFGYKASFIPGGLPSGMNWFATINGINFNGTGGSGISTLLFNGSYQANFSASGGYQAYPGSIHFTISGSSFTATVIFESPGNQTFIKAESTFSTRTMRHVSGYAVNYSSVSSNNCISSIALDQSAGTIFAALPAKNEIIRYNISTGIASGSSINIKLPDSIYYSSQSNLLYAASCTGNLSVIYPGNGTIEKSTLLSQIKSNITDITMGNNTNDLYVISGNPITDISNTYIVSLNGTILKNVSFKHVSDIGLIFGIPQIYNGNILTANFSSIISMNPVNGSSKTINYPNGFHGPFITKYGDNGLFLAGNINQSNAPDLIYNATSQNFSKGIMLSGFPVTSAYNNLTGIEYIQTDNVTACSSTVTAVKVSTGKILGTAPYTFPSMEMLFDTSNRNLFMINNPFICNGFSNYMYVYSTSSLYTVTFRESGISAGNTWNLEINGMNKTISGSEYTVSGINGTSYTYSISNSTNYYTSGTTSGTVVINGSDQVVNLSYHHWAYITGHFTQKGLNITVNGALFNVGNSTFNMSVVAGSYTVVISDPGYVTKYMNFTLSSGATENITATLNKTSGPGTPVPVIYYYSAAGVVGVIAAMAVAYVYIRKK